MIVNLSNITVPEMFLESLPSIIKTRIIEKKYADGIDIGKDIEIDPYGNLVDGYIRYVVLVNHGCKYADVTVVKSNNYNEHKPKSVIYVFAKHYEKGKLYVWKLTNRTRHKNLLEIGAPVLVATKNGKAKVIVEKIELLDKPPIDINVRRVIECFRKSEDQ